MIIELKNIKKTYDEVTPLKDVSATINQGDVISVIGPSGTGKSTLLRCINLLERPTSGELWIDGRKIDMDSPDDICSLHRKVGMVFQSFYLFDNLTVIENLMTPQIELLKRSRQEAYEKAISLLREVGMAEKAFEYPAALSGGQKQRVAIARTLAMDTEVILFDEPTSALDPTMVNEVLIVIGQLARAGKTMMIVTHEMNFARNVSNRIFYMDEGGIYEDGTPEQIFEHPQKEKTRRFINHLNVLELSITSAEYDYPRMIAEIYRYCERYGLDLKARNHICGAFEELCQTILVTESANAGEEPDISVVIETAGGNGASMMTVRYKGDFNPENTQDILALKMLKNYASSFEYRTVADGEYDSEVKMTF